MMKNFGSNPKIKCSTITDAVMMIGLRYFFKSALVATIRVAAGFRFFSINCNTEYSGVTGFKTD